MFRKVASNSLLVVFLAETQVVYLVPEVESIPLLSERFHHVSECVIRHVEVAWHSVDGEVALYLAALLLVKFALNPIEKVFYRHEVVEHA
mmetsp:Transcript_12565/g.9120  ORF Transcript_12565/g.9120 Transcript_12565/m.9120 type:complete len:90 (-) Transcript_12565:340-609(-)